MNKAYFNKGSLVLSYQFIQQPMERLLKPDRLNTDLNASSASREWLHWLRTFENFLTVLPQEGLDKLSVLTNYVSPKIFGYIEECTEYDRAIVVLNELFVKPKNEVFAHHVLDTRSQQTAESLDEYLQVLKTLREDATRNHRNLNTYL